MAQLNAIPTVGHSGVLTSYITAIRWMSHGRDLILEGYKKVSHNRYIQGAAHSSLSHVSTQIDPSRSLQYQNG